MMVSPILYDVFSDGTDGLGIGVLSDAISCVVTEEKIYRQPLVEKMKNFVIEMVRSLTERSFRISKYYIRIKMKAKKKISVERHRPFGPGGIDPYCRTYGFAIEPPTGTNTV